MTHRHLARILSQLALLLVASSGCRSEPASESAPASAPMVAEESGPAKSVRTARELIAVKSQGLSGPLEKLRVGMSCVEATTLFPDVKPNSIAMPLQQFDGVYIAYSCIGGRVDSYKLEISFSAGDLKQWIGEWGTPREMKSVRGAPQLVWDDAAQHTRARVRTESSSNSLWIEALLPARELLGSTKGRLGIEADKPIIGATRAELLARFAAQAPDDHTSLMFVQLPVTDYSIDPPKLTISFNDDVAKSFQIMLPIDGQPDATATVTAMVEATFGTLTQAGDYLVVTGPLPVRVRVDPAKTLWIGVGLTPDDMY